MKFRNLTPHEVVVQLSDGTTRAFPSEGVARLDVLPESPFVVDGIPILPAVRYGSPVDLPPAAEGTMLIVSLIVAQALPGRNDLLAPASDLANAIRGPDGMIVAVRALRRG
ncbi:MAG: hypothetical protein HY369_05140 [Candidatus Aenigmarchaeota archaeon]|nr:hypothetical protein [Candidatus Aenigmarchaeota archaeon]